jgi:aminocarboxymuconate-semialdehyde decarboxylase
MNPVKPGQRVMTELLKSISGMANVKYPIVDVHTHVYLPRYAAELRARTSAPRILNWTSGSKTEERLLILDGEPSAGRPVGPQVCL